MARQLNAVTMELRSRESSTNASATPGRTAKGYRTGTHRICSPERTLARFAPNMPQMGITRLANITGLDRVGIPVVMACRPNSRSISVSQGKGLTLDAAKASALMESVETWHAECIGSRTERASLCELDGCHPVVDVSRLPLCVDSGFREDLPIDWIEGHDLLSGQTLLLPCELVHTDYTLPGPDACECFVATTNGLASGNHVVEAICHGLWEVIERDASTLWLVGEETQRRRTVIDLDSMDDPHGRGLMEAFDDAEIDVKVWDLTTDVGIAAFYCLLVDRDPGQGVAEFGAGCHPNRSIALIRALTEAAQARTTYIAGSRDDFSPEWYGPRARAKRYQDCRRYLSTHPPVRSFHAVPDHQEDELEADLAWSLRCLRRVGIEQVIAVDLTNSELEIPVVRVVVPGLEAPYKGMRSDYVPGPRALAALGDAR